MTFDFLRGSSSFDDQATSASGYSELQLEQVNRLFLYFLNEQCLEFETALKRDGLDTRMPCYKANDLSSKVLREVCPENPVTNHVAYANVVSCSTPVGYAQHRCAHCGGSDTPMWRKIGSIRVCNACGLYYKQHGKKRDLLKRKRTTTPTVNVPSTYSYSGSICGSASNCSTGICRPCLPVTKNPEKTFQDQEEETLLNADNVMVFQPRKLRAADPEESGQVVVQDKTSLHNSYHNQDYQQHQNQHQNYQLNQNHHLNYQHHQNDHLNYHLNYHLNQNHHQNYNYHHNHTMDSAVFAYNRGGNSNAMSSYPSSVSSNVAPLNTSAKDSFMSASNSSNHGKVENSNGCFSSRILLLENLNNNNTSFF